MAKLFISHSSKDKPFARKLHADLRRFGHEPWLDEEDIAVGECIPTEIETALTESDFVVVVLSPRSVASKWVDIEWKAKYWDQIQAGEVQILPVLLEHCEKPKLLATRKHADFSGDYLAGFQQLLKAINRNEVTPAVPLVAIFPEQRGQIDSLLAKLHSSTAPLSQCIAEALPIADSTGDLKLDVFCQNELQGWQLKPGWTDDGSGEAPSYRIVEGYVLPLGHIVNLKHPRFYNNASGLFDALRQEKDCYVTPVLIAEAVPKMERLADAHATSDVMHQEVPAAVLIGGHDVPPNHTIHIYYPADTYAKVLQAIKAELTKRLLALRGEKAGVRRDAH